MNRINTSPMILRIVAFAIAAMMMLVIAFSSADMSEAKKKKRGNGNSVRCNNANVNFGSGGSSFIPFKLPFEIQYGGTIPVGSGNQICVSQR